MEYDLQGQRYDNTIGTMANEAGILLGVESFLKGLPNTVRDTLSAGELADTVLHMIENVRAKRREQQ